MVPFRVFFLSFITVLLLSCGSNPETTSQSSAGENEISPVADDTSRVTIWEVDANPESIAIGPGVIFATHFGPELNPTEQDGDGYISIYDANGDFIEKFATGLDAPKGMELVGNQLFVADVDSLFGYSISDGSRTFAVSFTGKAQFLNGLAAADGANLYISATDAGKIWKVNAVSGETAEVADVPHVNGLAVSADGSVIYAVQYNGQDPSAGRLLAVNPIDGAYVPLGSYAGMLDGVIEHKGAVYFTDWNPAGNGKVLKYDLGTQKTSVVLDDERLQGPADFEVLGDGLALIPMLTGSKILGVRLK